MHTDSQKDKQRVKSAKQYYNQLSSLFYKLVDY